MELKYTVKFRDGSITVDKDILDKFDYFSNKFDRWNSECDESLTEFKSDLFKLIIDNINIFQSNLVHYYEYFLIKSSTIKYFGKIKYSKYSIIEDLCKENDILSLKWVLENCEYTRQSINWNYIIFHNNIEMAKLLFENGFICSSINSNEYSPLALAYILKLKKMYNLLAHNNVKFDLETDLLMAVKSHNIKFINYILEYPNIINIRDIMNPVINYIISNDHKLIKPFITKFGTIIQLQYPSIDNVIEKNILYS